VVAMFRCPRKALTSSMLATNPHDPASGGSIAEGARGRAVSTTTL